MYRIAILFFLSLVALSSQAGAVVVPPISTGITEKLSLEKDWLLQSSCQVNADGQQISSSSFNPKGWHHTQVPATVLAALVADKTHPNPYFAMNLRSVPGTTYPVGANFAHLPMAADSPFHCSWWYRTEFLLSAKDRGKNVWLHFEGINYRANVWVNGKRVAEPAQVAGAYRVFEFNISQAL